MTIAIRTITTLAANFTQAQLSTALQTAFTNAGFTSLFDNYTSGTDLILVYALVTDASKTFGTTYLRVRITNTFIINQAVYSTWNATAHTGTGNTTEVTYSTLINTASVTFNALSAGGEAKLIIVTQGSTFLPLGIIAPATLRSSWNLNTYTCGFIFISNTMLVLRGTTANQTGFADNDIALAGSLRLATANVIDNERDLLTGWILLNQSNQGFIGRTSDDLAIVSASGSTRYDIAIRSGTSQQFLILQPNAGSLAIRIA
jgi:hypothetical protein